MAGLKPAVIGMIATAVVSVGSGVFFPDGVSALVFHTIPFRITAGIFIVVLVLALKKVSPVVIVLLSAAAGIAFGYLFHL